MELSFNDVGSHASINSIISAFLLLWILIDFYSWMDLVWSMHFEFGLFFVNFHGHHWHFWVNLQFCRLDCWVEFDSFTEFRHFDKLFLNVFITYIIIYIWYAHWFELQDSFAKLVVCKTRNIGVVVLLKFKEFVSCLWWISKYICIFY